MSSKSKSANRHRKVVPRDRKNDQSLKTMESLYLNGTRGARGSPADSVIVIIKTEKNKFRDLLPLLTGSGFPLAAKDNSYSACEHGAILYGSETW